MHKNVHIMLENLTASQYPGLDAWSKVKNLVDRIKTSALDSVRVTIWENTTIRMYFKGTVDLFKTFITR